MARPAARFVIIHSTFGHDAVPPMLSDQHMKDGGAARDKSRLSLIVRRVTVRRTASCAIEFAKPVPLHESGSIVAPTRL